MTIRTVRRQFFGTSNWIFASAAYLQRGTHCRLATVRSRSRCIYADLTCAYQKSSANAPLTMQRRPEIALAMRPFCTRDGPPRPYGHRVTGELNMKKLALAPVAVLSRLSIAGCTTAPPPPVVSKRWWLDSF